MTVHMVVSCSQTTFDSSFIFCFISRWKKVWYNSDTLFVLAILKSWELLIDADDYKVYYHFKTPMASVYSQSK